MSWGRILLGIGAALLAGCEPPFTDRIRNGKLVDSDRKAWDSPPCGLCAK